MAVNVQALANFLNREGYSITQVLENEDGSLQLTIVDEDYVPIIYYFETVDSFQNIGDFNQFFTLSDELKANLEEYKKKRGIGRGRRSTKE